MHKVLFTDHCRLQNFRPSLLRLIEILYTVIHKRQKNRTKVLPYAVVGGSGSELYLTKLVLKKKQKNIMEPNSFIKIDRYPEKKMS